MSVNDGGPAFPVRGGTFLEVGMSLRDYFAAAALQGLLIRRGHSDGYDMRGRRATLAYEYADAMLLERTKNA